MGQFIGEVLLVFMFALMFVCLKELFTPPKKRPTGCFGHHVLTEEDNYEGYRQHREDYTHPDNK